MDTPIVKTPYLFVSDIANLIEDVPQDSITSRTFYRDEQVKVILFAFGPGQSLSEHTASGPAMIHILSGEASLGLGDASYEASAGAWVHMEARLPHSVTAKTAVKMLLIMLQNPVGRG